MRQSDLDYLIRLATGGFYKKKIFRNTFPQYVKTGEDLYVFLEEFGKGRGYGQTVKKAVLNWIYTNSPEFVEKELMKSHNLFDGLTILRLFHPKPINRGYSRAFINIKRNSLDNRKKSNPQ